MLEVLSSGRLVLLGKRRSVRLGRVRQGLKGTLKLVLQLRGRRVAVGNQTLQVLLADLAEGKTLFQNILTAEMLSEFVEQD